MSKTEVRWGLASLFLDPNESSSFFDPTSIHADLPGLQGSFVADEVTATIPPQAVHQLHNFKLEHTWLHRSPALLHAPIVRK